MILDVEKIKKTFVNEQDNIGAPRLKQSSYYDFRFYQKILSGESVLLGLQIIRSHRTGLRGDPELEEPNAFCTAQETCTHFKSQLILFTLKSCQEFYMFFLTTHMRTSEDLFSGSIFNLLSFEESSGTCIKHLHFISSPVHFSLFM